MRRWTFLVAGVALGLALAAAIGVRPLPAQEENRTNVSREYQIKAAYLYQFGRYVQWPADAFAAPQSPFVIGVMEKDPIAALWTTSPKRRRLTIARSKFGVSPPPRTCGRVTSCSFPPR